MHFAIGSVVFGLLFTGGQCGLTNCLGKHFNYSSSTSLQTLSYRYPPDWNPYNCWFNIKPPSWFSTSHYLEIQWKEFEIEGNMPKCHDYVEVFLTRSNRSIGKYCSGNIKSRLLFNMYSNDSFASFNLVSDGKRSGASFSLTYQLKNKASEPLGGQPNLISTQCAQMNRSAVGNFYSVGWPNGYGPRLTPCIFSYRLGNNAMKIAVMDMDLCTKHNCSHDGYYLDIKDSTYYYTDANDIQQYADSISGKLRHLQPRSYIATRSSVYFFYELESKERNLNRGFVIGYIEYGNGRSWSVWSPTTLTTPRAWTRWSHWESWSMQTDRLASERNRTKYIVIGASIGGVASLVAIIAMIYGCYRGCCKTDIISTRTAADPTLINSNVLRAYPGQAIFDNGFLHSQEFQRF